MSELSDRIAAVIGNHNMRLQSPKRGSMWVCQCGKLSPRYADHLADAVIRELGLQPHLAKRIINGKPDQWVRRHVTDWEIVDE
jgi:hypothetical protein